VEKRQLLTPGKRETNFTITINLNFNIMTKIVNILMVFSIVLLVSCKNESKIDVVESTAFDPFLEQLSIEIYDSTATNLIDTNATFEILAKGFYWSEGPLWIDELQAVIFSDVPANKIYKWTEKDSLSVYLESAGHTGPDNSGSGEGPNGLILDQDNKLLICQHGDRQIARMDADLKNPQAQFTSIANTYNGNKFNSPNDLVLDRKGNIYFTDPPYGRPENKTGEIGINGVFMVNPENEVSVLVDSLNRPNGIALSLDEQSLYINQSDSGNPVLYSYDIKEDGTLENGKILFDFLELSKNAKGLPDGLKVHKSGNIFTTGPGGVHIISPDGKHLAAIKTTKSTANCAFDTDQNYLYMTTTDLLIRVKLKL
jgi:gluconolactonase